MRQAKEQAGRAGARQADERETGRARAGRRDARMHAWMCSKTERRAAAAASAAAAAAAAAGPSLSPQADRTDRDKDSDNGFHATRWV